MPVELIEVDHLTESLKEDKKERPWELSPEIVDTVRPLFPMWLKERHGIVVYQAGLMDSTAGLQGLLSFMPRMYEATNDEMHPAPRLSNPGGLASTTAVIVDWIWVEPDAPDAEIESVLNACFFYEVAKGARLAVMSGQPWGS